MSALPAISVLLPIYKEPTLWIQQAIQSILHQTFQNFELLLLLDYPEDKERVLFLRTFENDKRVQLIINKQNLGLVKTLNYGIELAKGKYIARLDADDLALPQRLEKQYCFLEMNPNIDLCGCQVLKIDEQGQSLQSSKLRTEKELLLKLINYHNIITHSTWLIKKQVLLEVGKYRNFPNAEDYDLVCRLLDNGKEITILNEVLVHLRIHLHGLTGGHSLAQKVCFKYIHQLNKERKKGGKDSFNEGVLNDLIREHKLTYGLKQQKARQYLLQSLHARAKKMYFRSFFFVVRSLLVSPVQRSYFMDLLQAQLIILRYFVCRSNKK